MEKTFRLFVKSAVSKLYFNRTITMSSNRVQKAMEQLENNPYYEKYSKKIAELQKTSPEEFLSRIEEASKIEPKPESSQSARQFSSVLNPKKVLNSPLEAKEKSLSDIMKIELIYDKEAVDIKRIWEEYHIQKDVISASIPKEEYKIICDKGKNYPLFLFPLPRSQGYEFIMCQFQGNTVHFTPLLCYQVHKENAPECLTMVHYTELQDSKGLVLMRGEFDKNVIDAKEAQCLANQLKLYYGSDSNETKRVLLDTFNNKPDNFKHMDLIAQLENISLTDAKS